jgi:ribosome biogenesis GTPase
MLKSKGLVIKSTGSMVKVKIEGGREMDCKVSGRFRMKGIRNTNPVAVGDIVEIEQKNDGELAFITALEPRRNYIIRKSINLSKEAHILASNIDLAILVITLKEPRTSTGFIDRFLVTCEAYSIKAHLVLNKIDLYNNEKDIDNWAEIQETYEMAGYDLLPVSTITNHNIEQLKGLMKNKVCLFSGHSGVGKSALINAINPELKRRVGEISEVHNKGKHTTTYAELLEITPNTFIIDTPGIKELGLLDLEKGHLGGYFPDIFKFSHDCRFNNCLHINEPDCAVRLAAENGEIAASRYINYLGMLNSEEMEQKRK